MATEGLGFNTPKFVTLPPALDREEIQGGQFPDSDSIPTYAYLGKPQI